MSNFLVRRRVALVALGILAAAISLAACGGGGSDTSSTSGSTEATEETSGGESSGGSDVAAAEKAVEEAEKPQSEWQGPTESPPAAKGKKVATITCAPTEGCTRDPKGFEEAAKALGWSVRTYDTNGTVQEVTKAMEQALNSGVDGIALASFPAEAVPNQMKRAEEMGVPVVIMLSGAEQPKQPGLKGGYLAGVEPNPVAKGEIAANWIVADSGGEAEVGIVTEEAFPIVNQYVEGIEKGIKACSGCSIGEVFNVPVAELSTKAAPAAQSYLASHPDSNYLASYDGALLAAEPAVKSSGREVALVGLDGNKANLEKLAQGGFQKADVASGYEFVGWASADQLNRAFAGEEPAPEWAPEGNGIPSRLFVEANAPTNNVYTADFDFQAKFKELWGLK